MSEKLSDNYYHSIKHKKQNQDNTIVKWSVGMFVLVTLCALLAIYYNKIDSKEDWSNSNKPKPKQPTEIPNTVSDVISNEMLDVLAMDYNWNS